MVGGIDYGEADRVVVLLTANGRLSAFAHGARKSRRRFGGALEPFTTIEMRLDTRRRGSMPTLASATARRPRLEISRGLDTIALAAYVAELGAAVAPEGDPAPELMVLVEAALDRLVVAAASVTLRRAYELRLIGDLGYRPQLEACAECGAAAEEVTGLDFDRGGVLCREHHDAARGFVVGPRTREWMMRVLAAQGPPLDERAGLSEDWAGRAARALSGPTAHFVSSLLPRPLKSVGLLVEMEL